MLFFFCCIDKPGKGQLRAVTRAAHIEYMMRVKDDTAFGGPLQTDDEAFSIGSIFAISFNDRAAAEAFIREEPYNRAGLFEAIIIRRWRQIVPESEPGLLERELKRAREVSLTTRMADAK
jgi:uncharacterized protein YciI